MRVSPFFYLVLIVLFGSSCLKNQDDFENGPKAGMVVCNYVVNNTSFDVSFDNNAFAAAPLSFGSSSGTGALLYANLPAGTHTLRAVSGTEVAVDNNLSLSANRNYSLFMFDTLKKAGARTLLLKDELSPIDSMAKCRFLQFIPENDTLTFVVTKNNETAAIAAPYAGKVTPPASFGIGLAPGDYKLQLLRNNVSIIPAVTFTLLKGKIYSFISRGSVNGTGIYKETVSMLQHN